VPLGFQVAPGTGRSCIHAENRNIRSWTLEEQNFLLRFAGRVAKILQKNVRDANLPAPAVHGLRIATPEFCRNHRIPVCFPIPKSLPIRWKAFWVSDV
jgi:hypothetical protein